MTEIELPPRRNVDTWMPSKHEELMQRHLRDENLPEAVMPAMPVNKVLKGQKALVTGANSGIGKAVAMSLANAGADVVVNYVSRPEAAEEVVEYYRENGPSGLWRVPLFQKTEYKNYGMEGYFAMLVGMKVPYKKTYEPTTTERQLWNEIQQSLKTSAATAYSVKEALQIVRDPQWEWPNIFNRPQGIGLRR